MFTKTALNKIKKADLVQMYLDLQAKDYDEKMEQTLEKCCNNAIDDVIEGLKKQIEDLEDNLEEAFDKGWETGKSDTHDEIDLAVSAHVKEIEELKEEAENNKKLFDTTFGEVMKLKKFKGKVIEAMKYDDDLDDEDIISGIRDMEEDIVGECELKKQIEDLQDERYKMCGIANANGWDIYPTDDEETDEESEEEDEDDTIKEVMNDIINQVEEKEDEGIITDGYGHRIKVPSEEECMKMFGVSKEVFTAVAKQSDCSGY
jgi:hypothetical protein